MYTCRSSVFSTKNGSNKIPVVSVALEIWIALNGWRSWTASSHGFCAAWQRLSFPCMNLPEPLIPTAPLAHIGEAKKALIPGPEGSAPTECDISQDQTQTWLFTKTSMPLRLPVCRKRCSGAGGHVPRDRRAETICTLAELGWQYLTHSQPFSPHLRASSCPRRFSQTPFLPGLFNRVHFCHRLDPIHTETTRKRRSSVPSQLKVCSANEAWLPS